MRRGRLGFELRVAAGVLWPLAMAVAKRDWRGGEHLPRTGGVIVVPNHNTYLDPLVVAHFVWDHGRVPRFLAKSGLFELPVVGRIIRGAGQIPVARESRDAFQGYAAAVAAVKAGECIIVYPEGTVTRDPRLWPMVGKTGAARIALSTGAPVIPLAQWGAHRILAPYAKKPALWPRKTVQVSAGPPVHLEDLRGRDLNVEALREATARIMTALTRELEGLRGERAPVERFDPRKAGLPTTGDPRRGVIVESGES